MNFRFNWNSPFTISKHDPDVLYVGGNCLFKLTKRGDASEVISPDLSWRDVSKILTVGSGADRPAARELALKIEEAAWLPSTMRDLETLLHGHLPATDASTGLVLILTDRDGRAERVDRARQALAAARVIGVRAGAIVARDIDALIDPELTPAGRLIVEEAADLPAPVAELISSVTPLQLLTERIARARGTKPDLIRREYPVYRSAADAAG